VSIWSPALKLVSAKSVTTAQGQTRTLLTGVMVRSSQAHIQPKVKCTALLFQKGHASKTLCHVEGCQAWIQLGLDAFYLMFWIRINMVKLEATLKDYNYCYVWSAIKLQFASRRFLSTYQMICMIAQQKLPWYLNYTLFQIRTMEKQKLTHD